MTRLGRLAVLMVFGMFLVGSAAQAERQPQQRTVRITGLRGQTNVQPDRTKLTATFTVSAPTAQSARSQAAKKARDLVKQMQTKLGAKGTAKLSTPSINSHWGGGGTNQKASVDQNVEVEFKGRSQVMAAKMFDLAKKAGANQVSTPQGVISPEKLEKTANKAVATAIRQGIRMSRAAARAAGGRAGRVENVSASAYPAWQGTSVRSSVTVDARLK